MNWRRGDLVACALPGDFGGKPRPALIVQSDLFNPTHATMAVCPVTSHLEDAVHFRIPIAVSPTSGLRVASQVMVDKIMVVRVSRLGGKIGQIGGQELERVDEALALLLGLPLNPPTR